MSADDLYVRHILDAIERINEYIGDISWEEFFEARLIQDGVVRQLEIVGEATKRLSPDLKASCPQIPWRDIAGMRDKLIHHYFGVDLQVVWDTVQIHLPALEAVLKQHQ